MDGNILALVNGQIFLLSCSPTSGPSRRLDGQMLENWKMEDLKLAFPDGILSSTPLLVVAGEYAPSVKSYFQRGGISGVNSFTLTTACGYPVEQR